MRRALAAAALAVTVGCGTGSGGGGVATLAGGTATPTPSASVDPDEALRQFAKCMRANGVDVPDPGSDGGGGGIVMAPSAAPQRFQEADEKCRHHLKDAALEGPGRIDPEMQDRMLKFARCMREHGVDMPDPDSSGAVRQRVGGGDVGRPFDPDDPAFRKAERACGHLFGAGVTREGPR